MGDFKVDHTQTLFMCSLYVTIGVVSTLCSLTTITLYLSNRELRRKYILYMVLDISELIDAISYILLGTGRGHALLTGIMSTPITVHDCFYTKYWPHSLILGTQLPAFTTLFLSFERILAVIKPATYKRVFTQEMKYMLSALVPIFGVVTIIFAGLSIIGVEGSRIVGTHHCAIITSTGKWYATFHFFFIVLAYVVSFCSTLIVWVTRQVWRKLAQSKYGAPEDRLTMILAMSVSSIFLLASPAVVMLTILWDITDWGDIEVAITYAMPGFLAVANTIIAFKFRKDLRHQFLYLIGRRRIAHHEHSMFSKSTASHLRKLHKHETKY
ncbi:unnamed protein product [Caenorhabditis bovis]|uniref:G-protein coupled receptors family 1 profile domain-containing protein n=1 Tax=Caenorhabditis bovis TaxID=2654633 RepID=A0A8S1E8L6_9PELO|nr:unnamed protein product [Caenorhabditis bovis]